MHRFFLLLTLFFILCPMAQADVFRWTDAQGNVHFSDTPQPGAQKINLPEPQTFSSPPVPEATMVSNKDKNDAQKEGKDFSIKITQPLDQETLRDNQGYVPVVVKVEPELSSGYQLQMVFDGKTLGKPQSSPLFALNNVLRGSHRISVNLVNDKGNVVKSSEPITIFMQRPRVGMVPQTRPARAP